MNESLQTMWIKNTPLRRLARVEEIVKGMLFIIENDFYNGRILQIDGGLRL
jgi:3-oxoacyl-[acyl-carrier protein] reductase